MSSIGAVSNSSTMMLGMGGRRRPDPAEMAEKLFSQLDTNGQGYIEQSDLQSALSKIGSSGDASAADLFSKLDADSDGKVTKDEFSSALKSVADQLDNQFASMRMQGGGMPPPPPENDSGFTKDELQSQLSEIGSTSGTSDSNRSSLISEIVQNFDKADTDGDGKVSFKEAMAYDQSQGNSAATGSTATAATDRASSTNGTTQTTEDSNLKLMMQMMRLMHAYDLDSGNALTTLSASA